MSTGLTAERDGLRMRVTGTLQRAAWLRKELPPVERVVPGV